MKKLTYKDENGNHCYYVNSGTVFAKNVVSFELINKVFDFAYEMCFGNGHHRDSRTGGQYKRKNGEKFCNIFQGKLAEVILYNYFVLEKIDLPEPDFSIYGLGIWDDSDLEIQGKKINIKSVAFFSNLLLLETKDWNADGHYIPNLNQGNPSFYDYFVLVRIQPDLKSKFKENKILYSNEIDISVLKQIVFNAIWNYDIAGFISNSDLVHVISNKNVLPQNALLNGKVPVDAENYYVQSGDLKPIKNLLAELKTILQ